MTPSSVFLPIGHFFMAWWVKKIPFKTSYATMVGLSSEAKDKLSFVRPENIGQAMRISGISTADISVVMINLRRK